MNPRLIEPWPTNNPATQDYHQPNGPFEESLNTTRDKVTWTISMPGTDVDNISVEEIANSIAVTAPLNKSYNGTTKEHECYTYLNILEDDCTVNSITYKDGNLVIVLDRFNDYVKHDVVRV